MSAASLLKVYDGLDPELAFATSSGATPDLAAVLAAGASANAVPITDAGDITGNTAGDLTVSSGAGHGLILEGAVGASLTATTGGCKVESTAGVLELNAAGASGDLNIVLDAGKLTNATTSATAVVGPTWTGQIKQLQIQVGGVNYWIPLNASAFA